MSLHHAAQHLKAQGRGPDDQLIHMSSKEIAGLQALAKAHGTSLTTNPTTGLPEAGVLDNLMPMIVGAGLAYATGGASLGADIGLAGLSNEAIIGGGMGLAKYAQSGNLGSALMTGLGGYGGAGLGAGLAATGAGPIPAYNAATSGQVAPALTAPPSAGGLAGPVTDQSLATGGGRDALLARSVPEAQMADQLAQTTMSQTPPGVSEFLKDNKAYLAAGAAPALAGLMAQTKASAPAAQTGMIRPYNFAYNAKTPTNMVGARYVPGQSVDTSERQWFDPQYTALTPYKAAAGGLMDLSSMAAGGGPVEQMSNQNAIGANASYPMAGIDHATYATPWQTPTSQNVLSGSSDVDVDPYTGEQKLAAGGGISTLGGYSDGGRLLKGPGDGMSDNIPAQIGAKQPARLADGEFVVPADVVSHLGNGSTDAGAKQLYKMMDRIRQQRTGKKKQAPQVNPSKAMPA